MCVTSGLASDNFLLRMGYIFLVLCKGQVISDYTLNMVSALWRGSRFCYSPVNSVDVSCDRQLTLWNYKCRLAYSREQIQSQLSSSIFTCAALSLSQCMYGSGVNQRLRHSPRGSPCVTLSFLKLPSQSQVAVVTLASVLL